MALTPALIVHISAGGLAIVTGAVALYARKGERVHRSFGTAFVLAMLTMSAFASYLAVQLHQTGNLLAGPLTFYLVGTAWLTARRSAPQVTLVDYGALAVIVSIAAILLLVGVRGLSNPRGLVDGAPAQASIMLASVAAIAALTDFKVIAQGGIAGAARIARHLWRMCFALFVASGSFFLGQQKIMPKFMHGAPILYVLALAPLVLLAFWLVRVRIGKRFKTDTDAPALLPLATQVHAQD